MNTQKHAVQVQAFFCAVSTQDRADSSCARKYQATDLHFFVQLGGHGTASLFLFFYFVSRNPPKPNRVRKSRTISLNLYAICLCANLIFFRFMALPTSLVDRCTVFDLVMLEQQKEVG